MPPTGSRACLPWSLMGAEPQHLPPKVMSMEPGSQMKVPDSALRPRGIPFPPLLPLQQYHPSSAPPAGMPTGRPLYPTLSSPTQELQCFTCIDCLAHAHAHACMGQSFQGWELAHPAVLEEQAFMTSTCPWPLQRCPGAKFQHKLKDGPWRLLGSCSSSCAPRSSSASPCAAQCGHL